MKKAFKTVLVSLVLLLCTSFLLTGCSSNSTDTKNEPTPTRTVHYTDTTINRALDDFKKDYEATKEEVNSATNEDADRLKKDISQIKVNVEAFDKEMTKAVEDNRLTEETKKKYDTAIETLKTDLDKLDQDLNEKVSGK